MDPMGLFTGAILGLAGLIALIPSPIKQHKRNTKCKTRAQQREERYQEILHRGPLMAVA